MSTEEGWPTLPTGYRTTYRVVGGVVKMSCERIDNDNPQGEFDSEAEAIAACCEHAKATREREQAITGQSPEIKRRGYEWLRTTLTCCLDLPSDASDMDIANAVARDRDSVIARIDAATAELRQFARIIPTGDWQPKKLVANAQNVPRTTTLSVEPVEDHDTLPKGWNVRLSPNGPMITSVGSRSTELDTLRKLVATIKSGDIGFVDQMTDLRAVDVDQLEDLISDLEQGRDPWTKT
jgi:hypothetical protein